MLTARAAEQNVDGYQRHRYLVPLHDEGQAAQSYLFAVGRSHAEDADSLDVIEMLASLVVGFGAPWRRHVGREVAAGDHRHHHTFVAVLCNREGSGAPWLPRLTSR